ncbi:MAG: excinuclease ABC subunit UvrA [Planctomycetota bacterium]|jgi:excinuclease ABC subunit A
MLIVRGAREHNLKGVDVSIPRGALTTITGVSGSGKSSLAFDTIYREGQRRFLESLSSYARQFLGGIDRPAVEHVEGLSPAVSIDQKTVSRNPRSTVGTITEIYDYLRLLYARLGVPGCPECGRAVRAQSPEAIVERILRDYDGARAILLAPMVRDRKGEYRKELNSLLRDGFVRARIDGKIVDLKADMRLERYKRHTIEVVMDRLVVKESGRSRIAEGVERALERGDGFMHLLIGDELVAFSRHLHCVDCGIDLPELEPRLFSFNSPRGACPDCGGLGVRRSIDPRKVVADPSKSIRGGALAVATKTGRITYVALTIDELGQLVDVDKPWSKLSDKARRLVLHGDGGKVVKRSRKWSGSYGEVSTTDRKRYPGVLPALEEAWRVRKAKTAERFVSELPCSTCDGRRLRPAALAVKFQDRAIDEVATMAVEDALALVDGVELTGNEALVGDEITKELRSRLGFLEEVGLGYLTLDRSAATLAGGEAQRIRLATQVGAGLKGVTYVLDEPSIGLHSRDNTRLIGALKKLRDAGNTVLVVEHDDETMRASDYLIDVGPGAGTLGGEIVAEGYPAEVWTHEESLTAAYLRGDRRIDVPPVRREPSGELLLRGVRHHNLKGIDVPIPLGVFVCVTGVSGSGKSSLVHDVLRRAIAVQLHGSEEVPGEHDAIEGVDAIDKVIEIDQSPIGRTPRSNPATYTKLFDDVRELFAKVPESRARGYLKGRFSFNVKGGRCEECLGAGVKTVEMQFLPNVEVICEECSARRFNDETLEIRFKEKSISDVLDMTVADACEFFRDHPRLNRILGMLRDVGLGYVSLGQPATTLSGGEAQRVKIARELGRPGTGRTLYLLDEPTTGLHHEDVKNLLESLGRFVDRGNTVLVVEHNLDVVKSADRILDLGPEGGSGGGELVATGTPEEVAKVARSHTGRALKSVLKPRRQRAPTRRRKSASRARDLIVKGASLHNLKDVDVCIPADSLTVITGPSGSGKTSLAFDTIFAEGQRRYVESLSTYARRFLGRMDKPPVESIAGLGPAIAIDQRNRSRNPRSTVATTTEIHDYLRLLFARAGTPRCPVCDKPLTARAPSTEARRLAKEYAGRKLLVLAPVDEPDFKLLQREGYSRLYVDGKQTPLKDPDQRPVHVIVDRIAVKGKGRIAEALQEAYRLGHGRAAIAELGGEPIPFTEHPGCSEHGVMLPAESLDPRMFSFNSHHGACDRCHGLGIVQAADRQKTIRHPGRTYRRGALGGGAASYLAESKWYRAQIEVIAEQHDIPLDKPMGQWDEESLDIFFDGTGDQEYEINKRMRRPGGKSYRLKTTVKWAGASAILEGWYKKSSGGRWTERIAAIMRPDRCPECDGERLNPLSRAVTVGRHSTIGEVGRMGVQEARTFFDKLKLRGALQEIVADVLREIRERLGFLDRVGLGYLTLDRGSATLSGGESQRIRLATQIGSGLVGVVYVLDEPTIGLHPKDTERLMDSLRGLRDLGNTVLLVEHDSDVIRSADHVIDLGPGAGKHGGKIVFSGKTKTLLAKKGLPTADFVSGRRKIERPPEREAPDEFIQISDAHAHNLKHIDVKIPTGRFTGISGVSGAGKSSLLFDVLWATAKEEENVPGTVEGLDDFGQVYVVDQHPIGMTPASNPATYTKCFDPIRKLFAQMPESRMRGYDAGRFSFNRPGGRCEACEGRGAIRVEMHFLADVWVPCDECQNKRYNRETLQVRYKDKTIADVLEMEIAEAREFFEDIPAISRILSTLDDVGLGYVSLGQPATTLSGGEAQRVKLATELARRTRSEVLYLLDEPTCGLHPTDVEKLVRVLHRLVDQGHTVVVVEHNTDLLETVDWLIELGPGGGHAGGHLLHGSHP